MVVSYILFWEFFIYSWYESSSRHDLQMFSPTLICLFIFVTVIFEEQKVLILTKSNLSIFSLMDDAFGVESKISLPNNPRSQGFLPMFSSRSFIVDLTFKIYDPFWINFYIDARYGSKLIFFCIWKSNCLVPFVEKTSLSLPIALHFFN